jgi:DNA repair protein SbcC/Rad50
MRPHRLETMAFGAFADAVELDFDRLGAGGLVLLCGETGGGKTTLLDAIGFALYGVVPGMRGRARDLRSHHAQPETKTSVRLEFSAGHGRFRVRRTPAFERPKRGGGTVREHPTALLERRVDDRWEALAGRLDDVGHEIGLLVGMTSEQFFQVIMLPQGRFADFLHADHETRERLLKHLFHVDRFEHAERALAARAASAADRVAAGQFELARLAAKVAQASGAEEPADPADPAERAAGWVDALAASARQAHQEGVARVAELGAARDRAEAALEGVRALARRQDERRAAELRLAELLAEQPELAEVADALDAARRAGPVRVTLDAVAGRDAEHDRAAAADRDARAALTALGAPGDGTAAELTERGRAARTEIGRLATLVDVLAAASREEADTACAAAEAAAHTAGARAAERWLSEELPGAREQAGRRMAAARAADALLPGVRERSRLATELAYALRDLRTASVTADAAGKAAKAARDHARALRRQRFEAITAELAAALVAGTPCPVCGSPAHPDPTGSGAGDVSKDDELDAEDHAAEAEAYTAELRRDADMLAGRVRMLLEALGALISETIPPGQRGRGAGTEETARLRELLTAEPPSADDFDRYASDLTAAGYRLEVISEGADDASELLADLVDEDKRRTADLAAHTADARHARRRAEEAAARAAGHRGRLTRELGVEHVDDDDLAARRNLAERLAAGFEAAAASAAVEAAAATERERARAAADREARAAGFDDVPAARAAGRDEAWLAAATDRLDAHRDALAGVNARLASDALAVDLDPPAPVREAGRDAEQARKAHEAAIADARLAEDLARQLGELAPAYAAARAALTPLRDAAAGLRDLAELAAGRGENRLGMPLSSFVLAARLEEVTRAANARLTTMTGGRFTLVHDGAARPDRRRRGGLGLLVEDAWTGRRRDTATLSGGETFQAALSLALGLADVVTAESGGRAIDALFVDEGFGSLDPDSLEEVMTVLDDLRSGGRLVGVVSHVAELRQRIPTQIQVLKSPSGSSVRTSL